MAKESIKKSVFSGKVIAGTVIVVLLVVVGAFFLYSALSPQPQVVYNNNLQHFSSYTDLVAKLSQAQSSGNSYYRGGMMINDLIAPTMAAGAEKATGQVTSNSSSSPNYSTTNVQVEGVDEADIIKTDGTYAYAISGQNVYIIEAYPADNAKIVSKIVFDAGTTPNEIFIDGDRLLIFSQKYSYYYGPMYRATAVVEKCVDTADTKCGGSTTQPEDYFGRNSSITSAKLYNTSDKANPTLEKEVEFEGSYVSSRLIGNNAYFVINSNPRYSIYEIKNFDTNEIDTNKQVIPLMRIDGVVSKIADATQIGSIPDVMPQSFVTIASLNMATNEVANETVLASGDSIYASQENLYIAAPVWYWNANPLPMSLDLVASMFASNWNNIDKVSVSKFHLDNGKVEFVAENNVPGHILNQFSMDEYKNNFRIATTVESQWNSNGSESLSRNNIYVLNSDMNVVGSIEDIAPGEKIYSARFMGDKGYLVTFKHVDPLFVLDLSNPANPQILGKLKIPGYSDYMQPIDETHILGIGKDVDENIDAGKVHSPGAVYYTAIKGVKMAVFDVTDVANPKEMYKVVIGDRGTDSPALTDHKALLFDAQKQLLVLPILLAEVSASQKNAEGMIEENAQGEYTFQGAFVYNLSLENGFTERGRITHLTAQDELKRGYYFDDIYSVKRSFYIGDVLYTFSDNMLKASDLATLGEVKSVDLNAVHAGYYYGGVPEVMID